MTRIAILEYSFSKIIVIPYEGEDNSNEAVEKYLVDLGFKLSQLSYMTVQNDVILHIEEEMFSCKGLLEDRRKSKTLVKSIDEFLEKIKKGPVSVKFTIDDEPFVKVVDYRDDFVIVTGSTGTRSYSVAAFKKSFLGFKIKASDAYYTIQP